MIPEVDDIGFSVKVDLAAGLLIIVKLDSWSKAFLQLLLGEEQFLPIVKFEDDLANGERYSIFSDLEFVMRTHDGELVMSQRTPRFLPEVGVLTACIPAQNFRANPADAGP